MAQSKKAVKNSTANETSILSNSDVHTATPQNQEEIKGINIPPTKETCLKSQNKGSQKEQNAQEIVKVEKRGQKPIFEKVKDRLDDLINYVTQGLENIKIAELLNISESSFYRLMADNQEFKEAYQKGIDNRKFALEKALLKRAEGFEAIETVTEKDEKGNIVKTKTTNKHYVPDTTALIFSLKNLYGDKYKDRVETVTDINININQVQQLSDEELSKLASNNIVEVLDYNIE